jgi:hypothetical protein
MAQMSNVNALAHPGKVAAADCQTFSLEHLLLSGKDGDIVEV